MRKTVNRFRNNDEKPAGFSLFGNIKYREFIWRTERPPSWDSFCLIYDRRSRFFSTYCFQTLQRMSFDYRQFAGKTPYLRQEAFLEMQWWAHNTIAILGIPSSFQAIIFTFSAIESLPVHLMLFLLGI